jgi:very-short-patch-repair endonuclease
VSSGLRSNARALRKNSTDAERILWSELRDHRLNGASFRRQVPIRNFIADFVCHAARLVIEAQGFQVLRFSNLDIMANRAGVLETIAAAVAERAPTLTLPRKRESGQQKPSS